MTVLGTLEGLRPSEHVLGTATSPTRSSRTSSLLTREVSDAKHSTKLHERITANAEAALATALRNVEFARSSTTFAALAQAQLRLGRSKEALESAYQALELSVGRTNRGERAVLDAAAAKVACELMARLGEDRGAYEMLSEADLPPSLRLVVATLASNVGEDASASRLVESLNDPLAESFRGYLMAAAGEFQKAIPHLRAALRGEPNDVDALLNLSISFHRIGATKKAVAAALRATRAAPGRKDISLHFLELLLDQGSADLAYREVSSLLAKNVVPDSHLVELQGRIYLARGSRARGLQHLRDASALARLEGDTNRRATIESNLTAFNFEDGRMDRDAALGVIRGLVEEAPDNAAVVLTLASLAVSAEDADLLRAATARVLDNDIHPAHAAYLRYSVALLEGNNEAAANAASRWFKEDSQNSGAAAAAVVSMGIGAERWDEAALIAEDALARFHGDRVVLNNSAYVLAMAGRAADAITLLESEDDPSFFIRATLGLAYLAKGDIHTGMRLYREAAVEAETKDPAAHVLMTLYQALVTRQLGLDTQENINALALAPVPLPSNWANTPEFLRLKGVCDQRGYEWPPSL